MNALAYAEAAVAALVALWLAAGLLANPLVLGAVALLVLLPLALVVLPALAVRAFGDRSMGVRPLPDRFADRALQRTDESAQPRPERGVPSDD
jgi:membrane protein implicated in regulation of membrane protease activity